MTTSLSHHFVIEACNNAWANHRLLSACSQLTHEEFIARRVSFFPSLQHTLNHILTVDEYYLEMLERSRDGLAPHEDPGRHFEPEIPFAECRTLATAQRDCDQRLILYCGTMDDARMEEDVLIPRKTGVMRDRVHRILAHLFQHQIHHRGQAHAMLAGTHVKPPQLDEFYCANEAHLREKDFEELGFDEKMIWG